MTPSPPPLSVVDFADYFANAPIGLHCLGPEGVILAVNHAELALLGYGRHEYVGHDMREFHVDPAVAGDILDTLRRGEAILGRRVVMRAKDGTSIPVVLSANALVIDGRLVYTRGLIREIRGEIETERQLALLGDVGHTLARTLDPDVIWRGLAEAAHQMLAASNVVLYKIEPGSSDLVMIEAAGDIGRGRFGRLPLGIGAAGLAARERRTVVSANVLVDAAIPLTPEAKRWLTTMPHRAALAVPMVTDNEVFGVFGVGGPAGRAFSAAEVRLVEALADHAAMAARNAHLFAVEQHANRAAELARRGAAFLAEASRMLAGWIDDDTTLGAIAELVIVHHADACLIDVAGEDGRLRRVAAATRDRSRTQLAREFLDRYPPDPAGPHPIATAMRTGQSVLQPEMPDAFFDAIARDAEHRRLTRELGLKSSIVVPMVARGRPLGTISLFASESVAAYGLQDLELAEDLTRRVAFAVENAHLHRESERRLHEAELVAKVARDINASLNLDTVMQRIVDTAKELCGADLAAIFLREGATGAAVPRYGTGGVPSTQYRTVRIEPGKGLGGQVLLTGEAARTANYPEDPRFSEEYRKLPESERIGALLAVRLRYGGRRARRAVCRQPQHAPVLGSRRGGRAAPRRPCRGGHSERRALRARAGGAQCGRGGQPGQGRVRGHALPRAADAAQRDPGLGADAARGLARRGDGAAGPRCHRAQRAQPGSAHRGPPRRVAHHHREGPPRHPSASGGRRHRSALDTLRPAAEAKAQHLSSVLDPRAGQVAGDPDRLQQVVTNLLSNPIKFTPSAGASTCGWRG